MAKKKNQLEKLAGKKFREQFWPNWDYKGEYINSEGKLVMVFHDKDYPEFEKKIMLQARIDLNDTNIPRRYMYTQQQMLHDHVVRHLKLASGKQVEVRFSVIHRSGADKAALTQAEIDELYEVVRAFEWKGIVQSVNQSHLIKVMHEPVKPSEKVENSGELVKESKSEVNNPN